MIEKLIAFLEWLRSSEKLRNRVDRGFSLLFLFVSIVTSYTLIKETLFRPDYYRYDGVYRWALHQDIVSSTFLSSIVFFLLFSLFVVFIYGIYKSLTSREFSVMGLVINSALPLLVGIMLIAYYHSRYMSNSDAPWYMILFGSLYAASPYGLFLSGFEKWSPGFLGLLTRYFKKYTVASLIGFALFVVIFAVGTLYDEFRYSDFAEIVIVTFLILCAYGIGTWIILTYAWSEVGEVTESSWKNILKGGVVISFLFTVIWLSPDWKNIILNNRIKTAYSIIQADTSKKGYVDAASVWGLKWAMKEQFLAGKLYDKNLYATLFDESIESVIEEEIDVNTYRARNSNGTSMLARGENAKVELNFAKHESEIKSDIGAMETTITYEFQNTDTQNQEVIYSIELPSSDAVVTDLRLGLNLELTGTLAPRGAAEKVYNDSLRRNTDPALLEQTGPNTYRLRVFPVLSVNDQKTQGRQRVQFRYTTPIASGDAITVMPKTDILNLKLTEKSEIMTRVMEGSKALVQDSFKTDDIQQLLAGKSTSLVFDTPLKESALYCGINTYEGIDISKFQMGEKNLTKNIVFLDISKSAGEKKETQKRYQELVDTWKNSGVALDIYTFNTAITSAGYDLSDLDFWGNTDMAKVISYIRNNGIENANIVILTDDSSYESVTPEDKTIDYKKLKSNRISLIQIGDKIRTLKTEVTKSILASEGEVYRLPPGIAITLGLKNLFGEKSKRESCDTYDGTSTGMLSALQGGRDGRMVFGETHSATGTYLKTYAYATYITKGSYYSPTLDENCRGYDDTSSTTIDAERIRRVQECSYPIKVMNSRGVQVSLYYSSNYQSGALSVGENGYYILGDSGFEKVESTQVPIYDEKVMDMEYTQLLEEIGMTAHIVNQSMSLIALETDRQRADLERYSNQEDKYDTTYQNFTNSENTVGNRMTVRPTNFTIDSASRSTIGPTSATTFGASKSAALQSGDMVRGGSLSLGGGSSSGGGLFQYIIALILFPVGAWFVLRRKQKPQAEKGEEQKTE